MKPLKLLALLCLSAALCGCMSSKPAGKPVSVKTHIATIESWEQDGYLAGEGLIVARVTISGHTTHVVLPEEFKDQGHFFIHKNLHIQ